MPYVPPGGVPSGEWTLAKDLEPKGPFFNSTPNHIWTWKYRCPSCQVMWAEPAGKTDGACWLCGDQDRVLVWAYYGKPWVFDVEVDREEERAAEAH